MIIRGGTVVTSEGRCTADVAIRDGRITAVGLGLGSGAGPELDASGCYVLPGAIDPHTHIEMPAGGGTFNADTWHSATVAAAFGGTTTVLDMITPERGGSLAEALEDWQRRAALGAVVDYGFHMGIVDARPQVLAEIPAMVAAGVPSFKLYLAYPGRLMLEDRDAFRAMRAVARADGLVLVHAENGGVIDVLVDETLARGHTEPRYHAETRPAVAEAEATARACRLAELAGARLYVVHVTCREALAEVAHARRRGQEVLAETCTHYLLFTAADLDREEPFDGARWVLSPALRTAEDQFALWEALAFGKVDAVASDHCPWMLAQKRRGLKRFDQIPNGIPGVEERLPFLYTYGVELGGLTLERLVALTATNPARIFGLYPQKGQIAPGADADVVVWDPSGSSAWTASAHHCGCDHSPYEGMTVHGRVRHVLVRGRPVVRDGEFVGEVGSGRFVRR